MPNDFLSNYLLYTSDTEATATFHRWSALVGIGALLERNTWIQHLQPIYANHYVMLLGESGTRKSSAIKGFARILKSAGYETFAGSKTSKEKFLQDLANQHSSDSADPTDEQLFGSAITESLVTPLLIAADEANDFFGINNLEFLSILGNMWDYHGIFENKLKHGKSDLIPNPTISILSGNTPSNFARAFPSEIIGQGFFSRVLLVYGETTREKITWPKVPDIQATSAIVQMLQQIKTVMLGEIIVPDHIKDLIDRIYKQPNDNNDERFASYYQRRLTHLLKLIIVVSACKLQKTVTEETVLQANTYLTYIQTLMPKALGEYGADPESQKVQRVLSVISSSVKPPDLKELFAIVSTDFKSPRHLVEVVQKLMYAERVQMFKGRYLPMRTSLIQEMSERSAEYTDFDRFLTPEELRVKI